MSSTGATFTIGTDVSCSDGPCGKLTQVVVDPLAKAVTHLIVEPLHRSGLGKLVPLRLVGAAEPEVLLGCSEADFQALPVAETTHFLPGETGGYGGFGPGQAMMWPYYGLGGTGGLPGTGLAMGSVIPPVTVTDVLPAGEIAIRRGDSVQATDGDIGRVQGLIFDLSTGRLTHLVLQEGHFWGKHDVVIPIVSVTSLATGVTVNLTKEEIAALPEVEVTR